MNRMSEEKKTFPKWFLPTVYPLCALLGIAIGMLISAYIPQSKPQYHQPRAVYIPLLPSPKTISHLSDDRRKAFDKELIILCRRRYRERLMESTFDALPENPTNKQIADALAEALKFIAEYEE